MKALLIKGIVSVALMSSVVVAPAEATLIDRGLFDTDGIPGGDTVRLVGDNDLDITWLGDGLFSKTSGFDADGGMTWANATAWAASFTVGGYNDWRLPTISELGRMFYDELGGDCGLIHFVQRRPRLGAL